MLRWNGRSQRSLQYLTIQFDCQQRSADDTENPEDLSAAQQISEEPSFCACRGVFANAVLSAWSHHEKLIQTGHEQSMMSVGRLRARPAPLRMMARMWRPRSRCACQPLRRSLALLCRRPLRTGEMRPWKVNAHTMQMCPDAIPATPWLAVMTACISKQLCCCLLIDMFIVQTDQWQAAYIHNCTNTK